MCSNYRPVTRMDRLMTFFGVERGKDEEPQDVFPLGLAPFIRLSVEGQDDGRPALVAEDGMFGLVPHFAAEMQMGRRCYNARSETVDSKPSFRQSWRKSQRCIIPTEAFYEPNYETDKAVRWRIYQNGDVPMGIAGIYSEWKATDGRMLFTFSMLTVNADDHEFMRRFHKPDEEKRMVVILDPSEYMEYLTCPVKEASRFLKQWHGALVGEPAPLARAPKLLSPNPETDDEEPESPPTAKPQKPPRPAPPIQGDLF